MIHPQCSVFEDIYGDLINAVIPLVDVYDPLVQRSSDSLEPSPPVRRRPECDVWAAVFLAPLPLSVSFVPLKPTTSLFARVVISARPLVSVQRFHHTTPRCHLKSVLSVSLLFHVVSSFLALRVSFWFFSW